MKESILKKFNQKLNREDPNHMSKIERLQEDVLENSFVKAQIEVDRASLIKDKETVQDLREEIKMIEEEIKDDQMDIESFVRSYVDQLLDIAKKANAIANDRGLEKEVEQDSESNEVEDVTSQSNDVEYIEHFEYFDNKGKTFKQIYSDEKPEQVKINDDEELVEIEPLFHGINDEETIKHGLMAEAPETISHNDEPQVDAGLYGHLLVPNNLIGGSIACDNEHKKRIIDLYYAETTSANVEGYEIYTENIIRCTVSFESAIKYKSIIALNDNDCFYGVMNDSVNGTLESIEDEKVQFEVRKCQEVLAF